MTARFSGAYMVYNLAAVSVAASLLGCTNEALQKAVDAFDPQNGRLQTYDLAGRRVLLNLAKNPTGFNQNLKIVAQDQAPKVVAFFINDKEADGRDVSWLWDIDFEELAQAGPLTAYAGGIRGRDMAVRLKYAGIDAQTVDNADDLLHRIAQQPREVSAYIIANYTALPGARPRWTQPWPQAAKSSLPRERRPRRAISESKAAVHRPARMRRTAKTPWSSRICSPTC